MFSCSHLILQFLSPFPSPKIAKSIIRRKKNANCVAGQKCVTGAVDLLASLECPPTSMWSISTRFKFCLKMAREKYLSLLFQSCQQERSRPLGFSEVSKKEDKAKWESSSFYFLLLVFLWIWSSTLWIWSSTFQLLVESLKLCKWLKIMQYVVS